MSQSTSAVHGRIPVLRASGSGATWLSAFHAALLAVRLGHYNIVRLSSVIPPGTCVDPSPSAAALTPAGSWGDRLYCVYAHRTVATPGEQAWAGIGWVLRRDGGGGFLVEHAGENEAAVAAAITASLRDLTAGCLGGFTEPAHVIHGVTCRDRPVCALVIAPFQTEPWTAAQ
jgi:arginine decarboxylase